MAGKQAMNKIIKSSGNVFEDVGLPDSEALLAKAKLASKIADVISDVATELRRARVQHPTPWNSPYEGYAIILEELHELWDEVRRRHHECNFYKMREEAIQVAATAIRFIEDLNVIHPAYKFASSFDLIATELNQNRTQPQPLHSAHEGYALLSHAVCQLRDSVFNYYDNGGVGAVMAIMAVKVGVAAVRFVQDVIDLPA